MQTMSFTGNIRESLTSSVTAALAARALDESFRDAGYENNPYWTLYGHIADSIYALLGETASPFTGSVTHCVLSAPDLTVEQRVDALLFACKYRGLFGESA